MYVQVHSIEIRVNVLRNQLSVQETFCSLLSWNEQKIPGTRARMESTIFILKKILLFAAVYENVK